MFWDTLSLDWPQFSAHECHKAPKFTFLTQNLGKFAQFDHLIGQFKMATAFYGNIIVANGRVYILVTQGECVPGISIYLSSHTVEHPNMDGCDRRMMCVSNRVHRKILKRVGMGEIDSAG